MNPSPKVLVVDDEHAIVRALSAALAARDYRVDVARTGHDALERAATGSPDLIVLDLGLPDIDGIEVCRRIRAWSDVPIVVLTAEGADDVKVTALDEGADDYVTKPFSTPELLARLRVALRHHQRGRVDGSEDALLQVGNLVVDLPHHAVTVGGVKLDLTPKEFGFLATLARHPGRVFTHRMILQAVWGEGYGTETQYLRVYASQLRKKLAGLNAPELITEPGVGYRLVAPEAP
ncbi:response regulator transcription factor [Aquihabitans sp. McL0605]|uniref:response regulator transcription factor n=1 Tax=Aquihabitans sp. McL0605 TaxID=3415671 RepID=UPI003CF01574